MAVYRLPPVAQFQQPHVILDARSVDSPNPQPLPELYHLRRRSDFEVDQQPRRLLDVSVTQSVDAPIPRPVPPVVNLRLRHPHETVQQPRRLVDVTVAQSVDSPPGLNLVQLAERAPWFAGQQARGLPVDILAPVVVADAPTGNVAQALAVRPYEWQAWLQKDPLDVSVTQSVDAPPGYGRPQPWPPPAGRGAQWVQQAPGFIDVVATVPFSVQAYTQPPRPDRAPWLQHGPLDVSITQSVDSPPGYPRPQPWSRPPAGRVQWVQPTPGYIDVPVTFVPFTIQAFTQPPRPDRTPWLQRTPLDVSITQSVDSPPGYFRLPLPAPRPGTGVQWLQAAPGLISAPDAPNPQFNPWVYARQIAATQAWQKTVPVWHLVTVESPPLSGPYPTAPYRRPRYAPPVPMPQIAALVALPFAPPSFNPTVNYYRPAPAVYTRPGLVKLYRPAAAETAGSSLATHYLDAFVGRATLPDPGVLPQPCVFVAKVLGPVTAGGVTNHTIVAQYDADPQRSWLLRRTEVTGGMVVTLTPGGTAGGATSRSVVGAAPTQGDEWVAVSIQQTGSTILTAYQSNDGVNFTQTGTRTDAAIIPFDSNGLIRVGAYTVGQERFEGRIYSVELRTGTDPTAGTVQWRFDADDYPGTGLSYTDPRGQTWTLTTASAIVTQTVPLNPPAVYYRPGA